jgi:biopolymer transport protein ExbD
MAEIIATTASGGKKKSFAHPKRNSTRVDLTPMVDLGFLLITFFIITTSMTESKAMKLNLPKDGPSTNSPASTTLTLYPGRNDSLFYFHGQLDEAIAGKHFGWQGYAVSTGVGELIRQKKKQLSLVHKQNDLVVLINPSANSSYKNIVDLLDEMVINDVKSYMLYSNDVELEKLKTAGLVPHNY